MFERFTDRARRVLVLAQEEARLLDHNFIGTEHLLLGLVHEGESAAGQALSTLGITLDAVRARVREHIGPAASAQWGSSQFTPRAKKVLELSLREALQLQHNYIGSEHILLGLVREGDGLAAQVLVELGAALDEVRAEVLRLIGGGAEGPVRTSVERQPPVRSSVRPPADSSDAAVCPGCRTDLADTLRWRTQEVQGVHPADPVREVVVWWCQACGRTISVTPEGALRQAMTTTAPDAIPESEEVRIQVRGMPLASAIGHPDSDWIHESVVAEGESQLLPPESRGDRSLVETVLDLLRGAPAEPLGPADPDARTPLSTDPAEAAKPGDGPEPGPTPGTDHPVAEPGPEPPDILPPGAEPDS